MVPMWQWCGDRLHLVWGSTISVRRSFIQQYLFLNTCAFWSYCVAVQQLLYMCSTLILVWQLLNCHIGVDLCLPYQCVQLLSHFIHHHAISFLYFSCFEGTVPHIGTWFYVSSFTLIIHSPSCSSHFMIHQKVCVVSEK